MKLRVMFILLCLLLVPAVTAQSTSEATPEVNQRPDPDEPFNLDSEAVIAVLTEQGLIEEAGTFVLEEDRIEISGEEFVYAPLLDEDTEPLTDMVISATVQPSPSVATGSGFCGIAFAAEYEPVVDELVFAGTNGVRLRYLANGTEQFIDLDTSSAVIRAVNVLLILHEGELIVYVDGSPIGRDTSLDWEEGFPALAASGGDVTCAMTDVWVYQPGEPAVTVTDAGSDDATVDDTDASDIEETATPQPSGVQTPCLITADQVVNRRFGPDTAFNVAGVIDEDDEFIAVRRAEDALGFTWWLLADDTYVREDVVNEEGDCEALSPIVRD